MSHLPGRDMRRSWSIFVYAWKTTLAGTSTPSALELHSRSNALPGADKTRVKYVVKTFIEFDANAGLFSGRLSPKNYVCANTLSLARKDERPPFGGLSGT
jgi:hypothetical protein